MPIRGGRMALSLCGSQAAHRGIAQISLEGSTSWYVSLTPDLVLSFPLVRTYGPCKCSWLGLQVLGESRGLSKPKEFLCTVTAHCVTK